MKIIYAARFLGIVLLVAALVTALLLKTGLSVSDISDTRQSWVTENGAVWRVGLWLWLLTVFAWMLLVVTLMWSYLPSYRVPTMLQSGLMIIAAGLAVAGIVVWMNVLPAAMLGEPFSDSVRLIDSLAMGLIGAGLFMGGSATAWVCFDLIQNKSMPVARLYPGLAAGLLLVPAPFVLPNLWLPALGGLCWLIWCGILATRKEMPHAFTEWL
jgi:hypothetical protein